MTDHRTAVQPSVRIYTSKWCGYCFVARRLVRRLDVDFEEISLNGNRELRRRISEENGGWPTVPMIFVDGVFVGGYTELRSLVRSGGLRPCGHGQSVEMAGE